MLLLLPLMGMGIIRHSPPLPTGFSLWKVAKEQVIDSISVIVRGLRALERRVIRFSITRVTTNAVKGNPYKEEYILAVGTKDG